MKVVAFLPAKGTSSRVKSKNLKLFNGKPLFLHTLEKLLRCDFLDEVYVDSENEEILSIAKKYGSKVIVRDEALANNQTDGNALFMNEVNNVEADIYVQLLGTSPFIKIETIKKAVEKVQEEYDSAVLVQKEKFYTWKNNKPTYNIDKIPNSIDLSETIIETMGLYVIKKESALKNKRRIGEKPYLIEASKIEAIDIDYDEDFQLAESLQKGIEAKEINELKIMSKFLSSAILSDVLDDFDIKGFIKGLSVNIEGKKIFGRASTLKLKKLEKGEDFKGIYKALDSYKYMRRNNVIFVDNSCTENAYFGGLNSVLATKVEVSGAIIYGQTRDEEEVKEMDLPVFSKGYTSQDVRKRATVEEINGKLTIEGVDIFPENLIFADNEGIVVIPFEFEEKILDEAKKRVGSEKKIKNDIFDNKEIEEIINEHGEF